jgi:glutathione S-transferase
MQRYPYTALVMVLALIVIAWIVLRVGAARIKFNLLDTEDPPEILRLTRAAANTVEQAVIFVPALWLFASAWGDMLAAVIGVLWPIGRLIYGRDTAAAESKPELGFVITFIASALLLLGGLIGTLRNML